jgi:hypothetical protein
VNWRTILSVSAGMLLPVPLVLLLGALLQSQGRFEPSTGGRISPMLDNDQRARLMTYVW